MSRVGVALLAVCLAASCSAAEEQQVGSAPVQAALHLDPTAGLAGQPADGDTEISATDTSNSDEYFATGSEGVVASTPPTAESAAAEEVVRLLELEGLLVLDLRPEVQSFDGTSAVVHVGVVYGTGHPTSTNYRVGVHLVEQQWAVTSIEELHGELLS